MSDRQTIDVYDRQAEDYAAMLRRETPDPALVSFMQSVRAGGRILDLGCGPGAAAALMGAAGFEVDAVDASEGMVELANRKNGVAARVARFDDDFRGQSYDGVWANFSLLHASRREVPMLVAKFAGLLAADGVFHIGMKTGSGEKRDRIGRRYSYFSRDELAQMLMRNGFSIIHEMTGEGAGLSGEVAPWVVLQGRKSRK